MTITLDDSRLKSEIKSVLESFAKDSFEVSNYHSDVWICFRAAYARRKFLRDIEKHSSVSKASAFRNAIDDSPFQYGVEIPFAFDHKAKK